MKVLFFTDIGESVTLSPTWEGGEPVRLGRYAAWDKDGCVDVVDDLSELQKKYGDLKVINVGSRSDPNRDTNQK